MFSLLVVTSRLFLIFVVFCINTVLPRMVCPAYNSHALIVVQETLLGLLLILAFMSAWSVLVLTVGLESM